MMSAADEGAAASFYTITAASPPATSGSSSSCSNSTSSTSSSSATSFESTLENGELSVFTFMVPNSRETSPCSCSTFQGPCSSPHHYNYSGRKTTTPASLGVSAAKSLDYYCNGIHRPSSHILSDNNFMRLLPRTGDSLLLTSMERGVLFPIVHWSSKYNENLSHPTQFGSNTGTTYNQGVYKELKRVIPPDVWLHRDLGGSRSRRPTWLIIGYKSLEKTLDSSLEATWKEWTGVRHIYLNLRHDFEIQKISFLHRVHPRDNLDLFMYIVIMEIGNVHEKNTIWLLDFVQRMRMERMKGFLTVYSEVEQEISLIDDEYCKYFNQEINSTMRTSSTTTTEKKSVATTTTTTTPLSSPSSSSTISTPSSSSIATRSLYTTDDLTLVDHASEINGNLKLIEKILEEMGEPQPIGDYF